MRSTPPRFALLLSLLLSASSTAPAADTREAKEAATLHQLLAEVKLLLPKGWEAVLSPTHEDLGAIDEPGLIIRTKTKVKTSTQFPNPAPGQEPTTRDQIFQVHYRSFPFMDDKAVQAATTKNAERNRLRVDFEATHLREVDAGFMGNRPIPPGHYSPKNDVEKEAHLIYSLLWLRTEPEAIPSHRYKNLSFQKVSPRYTRLVESGPAAQLTEITQHLDKVIGPYPAKAK